MEWYRAVQFIAGVPMPGEWAREFGVTVNGMWDDHERWDRSAVEQAHREGRRVLIDRRLMALEAKYYEREENRHLLEETCRDVFGGKAEVDWYFWDSKPVYSMCFYSRPFRDYLLAGYRRAVDIGVDILSLDEPQTHIALMTREPKGSGFCPRCLDLFCQHLEGDAAARGRAGVSSVAGLRNGGYEPLLRRLRDDDSLYHQYAAFHAEAAFKVVEEFVGEVRGLGDVTVTCNVAGLGSGTRGSKLWGAQWGELVDFVLAEEYYTVRPRGSEGRPDHKLLPRGKFLGSYRLASSFRSHAPAWLTPQIFIPDQLRGRRTLNYYLLMFLESYANNGRFGFYWWPGVDKDTRRAATAPEEIKDYIRFISANRQYYEGCATANQLLVIYANSAVLENPEGHYKYLALAQALAEAGYQYDVSYSGDDIFTPSKLDPAMLTRYQAVLVAEAAGLTVDQREALADYAQGGGRVIAYSPNRIGGGSGIATLADDRLMDFWREYRDDLSAAVVAPLAEFETARVRTSHRLVNVVHYRKGDEHVCHVLNYDYREADDTIATKHRVEVNLPWADPGGPATVRWMSLAGEELLDCRVEGGRLSFTVQKLDPYGIAVIK
ncbi:MAG: hypothetical protein JSV79_04395 [Armatimonadota bacterium]|nr:MAG: hypothetical protein JSV79_04395 [Armatimonadota bacterium]